MSISNAAMEYIKDFPNPVGRMPNVHASFNIFKSTSICFSFNSSGSFVYLDFKFPYKSFTPSRVTIFTKRGYRDPADHYNLMVDLYLDYHAWLSQLPGGLNRWLSIVKLGMPR